MSRTPIRNRPLSFLFAALLATGLGACATITTHSAGGKELVMSQEEFAKYVERVFRYHNQIMNELIEVEADDALEPSEERSGKLSAAEAKMVEVCEPLNEVVSESLSGESVGLQTQIELIDTVPACEAATRIVDDLIPGNKPGNPPSPP